MIVLGVCKKLGFVRLRLRGERYGRYVVYLLQCKFF